MKSNKKLCAVWMMRVVFVVGLVVVFSMACVDRPSVIQESNKQIYHEININLASVVMVGNHSYIPINVFGNPRDHVVEILAILDKFEKVHPELKITSWRVEKQQEGYCTIAKIFGIWVDHKSKNYESSN